MARERVLMKASVSKADKVAEQLARDAEQIPGAVNDAFRDLSGDLVKAFQIAAPHGETEVLSESIQAPVSFRSGRVTATVSAAPRSPEGFDYLDVTRFGHRGPIRIVTPGVKRLRWVRYGRVHYAVETAGHHPLHDWVDDAQQDSEIAVALAEDRIGRKIDVILA